MSDGESHFLGFSELCDRIGGTTKKSVKVAILSEYLVSAERSALPIICRFLSGHVFPMGSGKAVLLGHSSLVEVMFGITSATEYDFQSLYLKHGDLGQVGQALLERRTVSPLVNEALTLQSVYAYFERIASTSGPGSGIERMKVLRGLLLNASPLEAKYIVKLLTGEMRIGLESGLVEAALAHAFTSPHGEVRNALLVTADIGETALLAVDGRLSQASPRLLHPTNFMLAEPMESAEEIVSYFHLPLYAEFKYDGVRAQVHKKGGGVRIFSRKLEEVSSSFPDIVQSVLLMDADFILDGEIVPFKQGVIMPFQTLQQRLRRRALADSLLAEIPVVFFAYDILMINGKAMFTAPLRERRDKLEQLRPVGAVKLSPVFEVTSVEEIRRLFDGSRVTGYEGLMLKDPSSPYTPGRRGKRWVKLKKELDTLDVVVVAAEYGHGRRAGVLSDYTFAIRNGERLRVVGKAYTGLTDKEILEMTDTLERLTVEDQGYRRLVRPEVVLEVAFDNIQRSRRHDSGYALRFPRIKRIRYDKHASDIDTLHRVDEIYRRQRSRLILQKR